MNEPIRCAWCLKFPAYIEYHDREWGVPVHDDAVHFEFLLLEGAQAGLSWSTILKKRAGYRSAFAGFDAKQVARFDEKKIEALLLNPAIVRNRLKVRAAVGNAQRFLELQREFGSFDSYLWSFIGGRPRVNRWKDLSEVPPRSPESDALSQDLMRRGFKFVGSTVMYAHMQACGLVNDHVIDCFRHDQVSLAGAHE